MATVNMRIDGRPLCTRDVAPHIPELLEVKIDRFTVSKESQAKIEEILNIKDAKTEEELRGIRNAVVWFLSGVLENMESEIRVNTKSMLEVSRSISGITAVIDNELRNRGYEV